MKPSNRLLYEYFEEYASERGNDTFLFDEKICYTVARAFNIAKSLARQLQNAGIKRGDFVAIKAERTLRTILLFYALQFIGGVAVLRDPHENTDDEIRIIDDRLSLGKTETVLAFDERDVSGLRLAAKSRSTSAVIFTSGSTGEKKAVCLSQYNFINNSLDTLHIGGYREDDVNILIVPVHHVFGLALIVTAVVAKHGIFVPKSVETDYVIDCMIKYNVTRLNGVPSLYLALAANPRAEEVKGLRCGLIGGAPCSAEQFRKIEQKLGVTLVPVYGMSECIGISCGDYRDSIENRCGSVGRIYSMNTLKIESDGEILIKSPAMAAGYLDGGSVANPEGCCIRAIWDIWTDRDFYTSAAERRISLSVTATIFSRQKSKPRFSDFRISKVRRRSRRPTSGRGKSLAPWWRLKRARKGRKRKFCAI